MIQTGEVAGVPYRELMEVFEKLDIANQFEILSEMYYRAHPDARDLLCEEYELIEDN